MLMAASKLTERLEDLHNRKLFKLMTNSTYILAFGKMYESATKRKRQDIRAAVDHILNSPEPFLNDGLICEEDMKKAKLLMKDFAKTGRIIFAFPVAWIIAFTVGMKIYVD